MLDKEIIAIRTLSLGKTETGARVHTTLELRSTQALNRETIHHRNLFGKTYVEFAATFTVRGGVDREDSGGQVPAHDRIIATPGDVSPEDERRINALWERYHLNGINAGCAHMTDKVPSRELTERSDFPQQYGRPDVTGWRLKNVYCPITGYRWGTAWLVEELPDDVVAEIQRLIKL